MDERFGMGVYASHGTKFVGECFDPYASGKGSVLCLFIKEDIGSS